MAKPKLQYGIGNSASTTLSSSITNTDTSAPLTSDTNFSAKTGEGMVIMDEDAATEELAYSTGKSGSSLTIPLANRGLEGGSAQAHDSAVSVKGILSVGMWNDLIDSLLNVLDQTTGAFSALKDANGNEILKGGTTASAVNEVTITNAATGDNPTISATGEADTGIDFENSEGEEIVIMDAVASAVNEVTLANAATGGVPTISATGGDTNIDVALKGKGTGGVKLGTGTVSVTDVLDEDDMASDSAVKLATQQSIKAYADTKGGFSTTVRARVRLGSVQTNITQNTWVTLSLNTEDYDTGSDFDTGTYTFTVPETGYYLLTASAYLYDVIADQSTLKLRIYKNGTTAVTTAQLVAAATNLGVTVKTTDIQYLTATDTLVLQAYSSNVGTDVYNFTEFTYMAIHRIS